MSTSKPLGGEPNSSVESANLAALFPNTFVELKKLAHAQINRSWSVDTLQTTALVNEAYLKLCQQPSGKSYDKTHFFSLCARAMRQILINYAEQKDAQKRWGNLDKRTYTESHLASSEPNIRDWESALSLDKALIELDKVDQKLCQLVELRYFVGLKEKELADIFGVTERTVRRDWVKAKALLQQAMTP